jgi:hypothetical protein
MVTRDDDAGPYRWQQLKTPLQEVHYCGKLKALNDLLNKIK